MQVMMRCLESLDFLEQGNYINRIKTTQFDLNLESCHPKSSLRYFIT